MSVNNNKDRYLVTLQNGDSSIWDGAKYNQRRDQLFNEFPTATATRVQDYDPNDDDIQDTDSFFVKVGDDTAEWDAATFNRRKEQLFTEFPKAQVQKLRRDDYWGEQGDAQKASIQNRLTAISDAEKGIHDAAGKEFEERQNNRSWISKVAENIASGNRAEVDPAGIYTDDSTYQGWLNTGGRKKYGADLKNYQAASQVLREAQQLQNSLTKDEAKASDNIIDRLNAFDKGTQQGVKKYATDIESWNQIVGAENAAAMFGLQKKIEKIIAGVDEKADGAAIEQAIQNGLNQSEKTLFDALQASGSVSSALRPKIAGSVKAGEIMAESARLGLEFMLFNGIAGAANRAASRKVEKYLMNRLVKDGAGKFLRKLGTGAAKTLAADVGAIAGGAAQTAIGPSSWKMVTKNAEDTMQAFLSSPAAFMNPETRAQYGIEGPKGAGELALNGFVQALIENATEYGLGPVNKLLGGLGKAGYRGLRKMGWNNLATLLSPQAAAFLNNAGIGNFLEETGEEVNGAIIDYFTGNKDALKSFTNWDDIGVMAASFLPMIGAGKGVTAVQRGVYNNRYNKAADAYRQYLLNTKAVNTVKEANDIINSLNVETPEELGRRAGQLYQALDQRQGGDKATEATLLTNLITATRNRSLANGVNQLMLEESRGDTRDKIMDNTKGRQFWQTREADMVDEGGTPYKGEEEYVDFLTTDGDNNFFIRKEDEDGNIETVDENGTVRRFTADEVERGLADGTFTGRRTMDMNDYLDERSGIQRDKVWQVSSERVSQMASYQGAVAQGSQSIQDVAYDAQQSLATLGKEALEMGVEADELENSSNDIAHAAFEARQNGNIELANTLSAYADAKATVEGLHEGYISGRQQRAEAAIDNQINTYGHDGEMVGATLGDKTVFIQSKDVRVARDGSVVVLGGSANSKVQIIDPATGETRLVSPAELSGAWSAPVDEYRQNGVSVLMEDAEQEYNTAVNTMSHSAMAEAVTPLVGHTAILTSENGEASPVTVVAVNPQAFTATVRDGSRKGQMNEVGIDVLYNQLQKNADGSIVLDATATNNKVEAQPEAQQPQQAPAQQPAAQSDVPINNYRGKVMLNGELRDVQVTEVDRDGTVQYDLLDSDGEAVGSAEADTPTFRAMIAAAQAPVATEEVSEAPAAQPEAPAEPKTPVERYTDPQTGKVNQKEFMDNEPAEWAKWNDERRGDNGENSRKRLTAAINALDAEIPSRQAELDNEPDPDVAEEKETALNDIKARRARFNAVLESYNAPVVEEAPVAEEVAEEPAEQPVEEAVEPEAPAEAPEVPAAPEVEEQPVAEEPAVEETPAQAEETNVPEAETEAETPVEETVEEPEAAEETTEEAQTIEEVEAKLVEEGLKPHDSLIARFIQSIQKLISTKAKALGKLNLYNYVGDNDHQPALKGVYHKDGYAYSSDALILIADKESYDKKNDGKIIGKDGKAINAKYPDVATLFKDIDKWQKEKFDFAELRQFLAGMKAQLEAEWKEKKEKGETSETRKSYVNDAKVLLNLDTDITTMVKFEILSEFADYAERIGAKEIRFQNDRFPLGVKTDKGMALAMPRYKKDYLSNVGRSNEETAKEANENYHIYSFGENGVMKRFDKAFKERGAARKKEEERQKKLVKRAEKWKKYIGDSFVLLSSEDDIRNMEESAANIEEALNAVRNGDHGWYSESSDKAYIYLPNIKDEAELDSKIMHEVLTHKGLLHLLGREQYDNLLDEVWDSMNEAQRAWAQNYYDRSQFSSDEAHRRAGTEEFLAKVAEKDESIAAIVDENFWTKFVEKVKEFINKMLEEPVFTNEVKGTWMSNYLMNSFVNLAAEKQRSEATAKAEEAPQAPVSETKEKYEDFGEKIGYARKDLATPTGKKGDADNRPAWVKKYNVVNVRVLSPEVAAIVAREGVRPFEELPTSITEGVDYNQPFVAYYEKKSKYGGTYKHYITDANRKPMVFTSKDQYEAALPVFEAKDQGYRVREDGGKFKIVRPASNGKLVEYAEFDTKEEAVAYLASPEGATDVLNRKRENYELPALSALTRNGMPDYRNGKDVTPQDILDTFGFRGGEFGNWLNAEERQQFLNYAYDALMDLANLVGISPKALSLGGELSIAFGARGKGGALAHYEPDLVVVNLTKMKGAGSLAHEWAHALDNYFGIQDSKKVREREYGSGKDAIYITEGTTFRQGTRKEVRDAFRELMKALTKKTVTRKIELENALAVLEQTRKWYDSQVESEREDLERGRTTRKYNRRTKEYDTVKYTLTDEQLAQFDDLLKQLETDPTFKWEYDWGKGGFRASGEVAEKLYDLVKDIMPNRKETYGPLNNVFYNLYRRALPAEERARAAREGLSETVTVDTDLVKESQWFDRGRASSYWATPVEMFARAFETYLANRMDEQGKSSDYLTYMKAPLFKAMWEHTPYPQGEELKTASDAFSKLFDTIQEKTDENGRTILFSRAFHGSANDFDQFDLFHVGEGEGGQAHGYGHYVSLGEGTAKRYSYLGERDRVTYRGAVPPTYYAGEIVGGMEVEMRNGEPFEEVKARIVNMLKRVEANRENADPYWRNVSNAKEIEFIEGLTKDDFDIKEVGHNLYTVEIPDDNGENYIDEMKTLAKPLRKRIADVVREIPEEKLDRLHHGPNWLPQGFNTLANVIEREPYAGLEIRTRLEDALGNTREAKKETSEILHKAGFVGMKYDGRFDGPCAVIFSDDDIKIVDHLRFSRANANERIFISNAEKAVDSIQQEKATPEQWAKMIESKGGLKAGEDKWIGLSDWLKASDKKSITKQEVLDYIRSNEIQIEETHYAEDAEKSYAEAIKSYRDEFDELVAEGDEATGSIYTADHRDWAWNQMLERYGDDFGMAFYQDGGSIAPIRDLDDELSDAAKYFLDQRREDSDTKGIESIRLSFTTSGLDNKREIALTVPTIDPYNEGDRIHFGDAGEGRAIAWIRFGDAYTSEPNGDKVLVIDEIQSKRHQDARTRGYKTTFEEREKAVFEKFPEFKKVVEGHEKARKILQKIEIETGRIPTGFFREDFEKYKTEIEEYNRLEFAYHVYMNNHGKELQDYADSLDGTIPAAPFEKNWHELAMKRMLRLAAEEGYDYVAWTTGEQQAERYSLSKVITGIETVQNHDQDETREVYLNQDGAPAIQLTVNKEGEVVKTSRYQDEFKGKKLSDIIGKELAIKTMATETDEVGNAEVVAEGDDLRVGGEGMKGFYDDIFPRFMNKYGKKWGVKVEDISLPNVYDETGRPLVMHSVKVTPEMKESVMSGQLMFSKKAPNGKESNLTDEQWEMVRTPAFKEWFGDWEMVARAKALREMTPIPAGGYKYASREDALNAYRSLETGENIYDGTRVEFVSGIFGKMYRGGDNLFTSIIPDLKRLFDRSVYLYDGVDDRSGKERPDGSIHPKRRNVEGFSYYAVKANIDGKDVFVRFTLMNVHGNPASNLHFVKVTDVDIYEITDGVTFTSPKGTGGRLDTAGNYDANINSFFEKAKEAEEKSSKVVDENGEPRVVYHGTKWNPLAEKPGKAVFDVNRVGDNFDFVDIDWNFFFTASEASARGYGNAIPVFLNIRNPEIHTINELVSYEMDEETGHDIVVTAHDAGSEYDKVTRVKNPDGVIYTIRAINTNEAEKQFHDAIQAWEGEHRQELEDEYNALKSQSDDLYKKIENEYRALYNELGFQKVFEVEYDKMKERAGYILDETILDAAKVREGVSTEKIEDLQKQFNDVDQKMFKIFQREGIEGRPTYDEYEHLEVPRDYHQTDMFALDNPNQIKSATANNGEFSTENDDIRFREAVGPVARLAEAEREVVDRKLDEMGSALGIPVNRVSRDQMPKGHEYDKGYYDPQTGEMYICMDNVAGINDAVATVLHESVGHLGLRRLLGNRFASTMQQIYAALNEKGRTWVNHYIATHNEAPATRAVEEYLSHLAESGDFMTTERSVWQQIKDIIARAIDAVFGTDFFSFTDDELNYILRASYENLQNPNWLNTVEGWAKDNLMRATLGFNSLNPEQTEDDEILFRENFTPIGNAADDYDQRVKLRHNKMVTEVQNLNRPVQIAYEEVMKETGKKDITEAENYIQRAEQAGSRAQTEQEQFERDHAVPILEQVRQIQSILLKKARSRAKEDANDTVEKSRKKRRIREYERILDYLYAVSALERNRYKNAELAEQKKTAIEEAEAKAEEKRAKVRADVKAEAQADALAKIDNDLRNELAEIEERYAPRDWSGLTSLEGVYDNNALNALRAKPTDSDKRRAELKRQREALRRSWWTEAERRAEERIARMRELVGDEELNHLWDLIREATDFNLQHALEHGLLTKEEYDRLHGTEETPRMWNYYLPLRGFTEDAAEQQYDYSHIANGNGGSAVVRKMNGRWSEADNPLANLFNIAQREIAQGWDNWAKMALYRFALNSGENSLLSVKEAWYEKNPETGEWELAQPRANETMDEFENRMQSLKENRQEDGTKGKPLAKKGRRGLELNKIRGSRNGSNEHIIRLKVAGQDKVIWVNADPTMARAVNGTSRGRNMALIRRASRSLSNLFTTYSLNFSIKNLFRDTIYSQLVLRVKESRSYRHKYYKNWIRNMRFLAGPMVRLSRQYENGTLQKKPNLTERERLFIDFMNDGGATGYSIVNSVDTIKRDIERSMRRGGKEVSKYRVPLLGHYAEAVKTLNEGFELLTRFTAYETSRQVGRSGQRAAADAKEISVNFNRRGAQSGEGFWGTVAAYFGATHYFFNAGVQGFDNFMNLIKTKPAKMTRFMAEFMLLGFLTPLINSMLAGMLDDDEDENYDWYWELPQWVRRNNLVMGYRGYYFAIPLSVEVRALYGMGDIAAMVAFSKYAGDNGFNVGLDAMSTAMGILPINPVEDYTASGNFSDTAIRNLAPDIMMPLVDIATNRDYTGRPLSKENPFTHNTPKSQAAFASTPKYLVKACQAIAKATATAPIHLDPNPGVWRDIFKSYGGGFYKTAEDVAKITMIDTDHPFRWDNMPFMSGFTGHLDEDRSNSFEIDALNAYKEISEDVVRRLNSVTGGGVTPAIAFKDPESLPDIAQAQIILEGKKYQLAKTYYDGMRNVYKINPKTGKEYTSGAKNLAHKGVNKLYDEWKALYDEWKLMPNASNSEKEAKAAKTLAVQQAWNLYRNAQGNLVDILLEMENGERLSGLEADAYELTKGLVF